MIRGSVEPSIVPIMVQVIKQIVVVPQMTSPQDIHSKEHKHEIP
jgi:hypothetical protein